MSWITIGVIPAKAFIVAPAIAAWAIAFALLVAGALWSVAATPVAALVLPRLTGRRLDDFSVAAQRALRLADAPCRAPPDTLPRPFHRPPPRQIAFPEDPQEI